MKFFNFNKSLLSPIESSLFPCYNSPLNLEKDKTEYIVAFVSEFAKKYKLSEKEAFNYLDRFKAVDFLERQYNIAHTLSFSQMVSDVAFFCRKNGGGL
ncbi:MAG: DUF3791 domain-containing protein [Treponema berlinense]|nr:DUF3791 domain-containing protein [Treponema berlinense]